MFISRNVTEMCNDFASQIKNNNFLKTIILNLIKILKKSYKILKNKIRVYM